MSLTPGQQAMADLCGVFSDGYCSCRCGPQYHWMRRDDDGPLMVLCRYHRRCCAEVDLAGMDEFDRKYFARLSRHVNTLRGLPDYAPPPVASRSCSDEPPSLPTGSVRCTGGRSPAADPGGLPVAV